MRKITVYSILTGIKYFNSDAKTYGEIIDKLEKTHPDLSNYDVFENINSTQLSHKDAKLPECDFTIYLSQKKHSGGSISKFVEYYNSLEQYKKDILKNKFGESLNKFSIEEIQTFLDNSINSKEVKELEKSIDNIYDRLDTVIEDENFKIKLINDIVFNLTQEKTKNKNLIKEKETEFKEFSKGII